MKLFVLLALFSSIPAFAKDCLKVGAKIELYGAVDRFHFFHGTNGFHAEALLIRTDDKYCVDEGSGKGARKAISDSFQLEVEEEGEGSNLKDGDLVQIEGMILGFGDTAWKTSHPFLRVIKVKKVFEKDPVREGFLNPKN